MKKHIKNTKTESTKEQPVKTETKSSITESNDVSKKIGKLAKQLNHSILERANHSKVVKAAISDTFYFGINLGDKKSNCCFLDGKGNIVAEGTLATTQAELPAFFSVIPMGTIAIDVGMHSLWVNDLLEAHGHKVLLPICGR